MAGSRWRGISLFAVTWLVLPLTTAWSASPPPGVGYNPGDMPPTWSQADQNNKPVTVSDFRGQSVILVFSAAWCGPCQDAVPVSDWLVRFLNQKGEPTALVEVLVENQFGDPAERIDAQDWADAYGIDAPVLSSDGDYNSPARQQFLTFSKLLGGPAYPTVMLLTPHSRIITGGLGFDWRAIENILLQHRYGDVRSGVDWLLTSVERLKPGSDLTKGLADPLYAALQALDQKKGDVACGQLGAFVQQVQAQSGKGLTADQAATLLGAAQRLRTQAGCP
jgi:thiol-disulfide isomerase/thioredoxin